MMPGDAVLSNPIWWVQFRLLGGARRVGVCTWAYAGIVLLAFLAACRLSGDPVAAVAAHALYFAGFVQLILILPGWGSRIHKAITTDTNVNMIESHRLSPTTGLSAALGYMIGPGLQIACLCGVNLIAGVVFCALSGKLMGAWLMGHVYILFVAAFVWSGTVLGSLCLGKRANLITVLFVILFVGGWRVVEVVPGLGLICGAEMIGYCYDVAGGGGARSLPAGAGLSVVVQVLVILLWLRGAAKKFERPDLPAFSVGWASLMYVGWLVVAVVGLERAEALRLPALGLGIEANWQLVATLVVSLLFMLVPLRSAAVYGQRWLEQHRELAGDQPPAPLLVGLLLAVATAVVVGGVPLWSSTQGWETLQGFRLVERWVWTLLSLVITGLSVAALYRAARATRMERIDLPVVLYAVVIWAVLPITDSIIQAYWGEASLHYEPHTTWLTGCSPVGGLIVAWQETPLIIWEGLVFQAALCLALVALQGRAVRLARARRKASARENFDSARTAS